MMKDYLKELYIKSKTQSLSADEKEEWDEFVSDPKNELLLQQLLDLDWKELDAEQSWLRMPAEREHHIFEQLLWITQNKAPRKRYLIHQIVAAAAITLIFLFAYLHYGKTASVLPGKNQAYIVLSNGKRVELSQMHSGIEIKDGQLNYTDGQPLNTNLASDTTMLNLITPKGGQYQLVLADGTKVWLNAASSIRYPASFRGNGMREVTVAGEAYFIVKHDAKRPFIVHAGKQQVRVLGTQFSVTAYQNELEKTTLLSGSVALKVYGQEVLLHPDQQAAIVKDQIVVKDVRAQDELAWTVGEFVLNNESLESIMNKLERWYDIDITYQNNDIKEEKFEGILSRFEQIDDALSLLQTIGNVEFQRNGRSIKVYYKSIKKEVKP